MIYTQIPKRLMKKLLLFYIKKVHFIYENGIYRQKDDVAMGSPLSPILARISTVELEGAVLPALDNVLFDRGPYMIRASVMKELKVIISRAYLIYSNTEYLQKELDDILCLWEKCNNFPKWVIE